MLLRRTFVVGALSLPIGAVGSEAVARGAGISAPCGKVLLVGDPGIVRFVRAGPVGETSALYFEGEDDTSLYTRLKAIWRREGVAPIAGLTTTRTFFCLSHAAADHGLRLIHRHVHDEVTNLRAIGHAVFGNLAADKSLRSESFDRLPLSSPNRYR